ncbi:hypothetical protein DCW30_04595 [Streptomyces alfalfae]|uniref:Uncharacterized protein n=1 Tax=Streptomyces alfalfae TaxID=1642299 RepID=A0ABM6GL04_9ACTN|nr:hypothetical protein A7J05_00690 [Streptomyces alfalfae]AYA14987.1 hypothetical protein D3X13_00750 [Streptomyces fradiae]RXX46955.1 hypothetical protein DCW30_04595 [Streptomyces alfalfae]RZM81344.1 hypothetical protein D4104_34930 [Streptomyces alfalfae]
MREKCAKETVPQTVTTSDHNDLNRPLETRVTVVPSGDRFKCGKSRAAHSVRLFRSALYSEDTHVGRGTSSDVLAVLALGKAVPPRRRERAGRLIRELGVPKLGAGRARPMTVTLICLIEGGLQARD